MELMNDAAPTSQPVLQELPTDLSLSDAADVLTRLRNEQSSTDSGVSVETPADNTEVESTEEVLELDDDAEVGLSDESDDEGYDDQELDDGQPENEYAESDVVEIDGQEVSLAEIRDWRDGSMKDADYRQKTEHVAEMRKEVEQQKYQNQKVLESRTQDLEKVAQNYAFRLGEMDAQINSELEQFQNIDWQELAKKDPLQYTAVKAQHDATMQQRQEVNGRTQQFLQQQQQIQQQMQQDQAAAAQPELKRRMPDWNDSLYYRLIDFGTDNYGFDRDAALNWTDPSTFECLRDAMLYREGKSIKTKKSVRTSPRKTLKPRASTTRSRPKAKQEATTAFETARSTGKIDDAVAALQAHRKASSRR